MDILRTETAEVSKTECEEACDVLSRNMSFLAMLARERDSLREEVEGLLLGTQCVLAVGNSFPSDPLWKIKETNHEETAEEMLLHRENCHLLLTIETMLAEDPEVFGIICITRGIRLRKDRRGQWHIDYKLTWLNHLFTPAVALEYAS